jgi:ABC-type dipeptide/oligopeptide/nickel transport system ATPase component
MVNPFSTKFWASGTIPFLFSESGESINSLLEKIRRQPTCQIVGPHGSGKSTLLLELFKRFGASGKNVRYLFFNDQNRSLPADLTFPMNLIILADGYEQLRFWDQTRLLFQAKRLIFTTHYSVLFVPVLYRTKPQFSVFVQIVRQIVPDSPPEESVLREAFERSHGNFRSAFFELYNHWEQQCTE